MTEPPPGGYPPPSPGGNAYVSGGFGALPQDVYTPWIRRVGATVIDGLIPAVIAAIGWIPTAVWLASTGDCHTTTTQYDYGSYVETQCSAGSFVAFIPGIVASVLATVFAFWNLYRQGKTGSTVGKSVFNFKVVSERDGRPIGFLMSIVRQICHIVDQIICYIGFLFPLWDRKRQTIADKIVSTVCLPTDVVPTAGTI
ncbi:MAG TPA: RDD family protein [Mycobacterium sp.]|jgi:uncharacterized RDD family membrane protein YckC